MSALFPRRRPGAHLPPEAYWGTPAAPLSSAAGLFEPVTPVQPPTEVGAPTQMPAADQDPPSTLRTAGDMAFRNRILANLHRIWA